MATTLDHARPAVAPAAPRDQREGVLYVVSNDPVDDGNATLAFRDIGGGVLVPLPGSPFAMGGKGYATTHMLPHFGPFDLDQNIIASPGKRRLFACNGGSDGIAVFDIEVDGALRAVAGSPCASGGRNPVSLGLTRDRLYVVNKNDDPGRDLAASLPNYSGFRVAADGALTPIPGARVELETAWRSPTQALVVEDRFIFDGDFGSFFLPARAAQWGDALVGDRPSALRALTIADDGGLTLVQTLDAPAGSFAGGMDTNGDGEPDVLMFGLQKHPTERLIYVSFVTAPKLAVYSYDDEGQLTFVDAVPNSGGLICWVVLNRAGTRAYTTNNASNTLSFYDLTDPRHPVEMAAIKLRGHGHPYQLIFDARETQLFVVKHRTFDETPVGDGSTMNVLRQLPDGTVIEQPTSPWTLPVRNDLLARPQGVVVL